MKYILSLLFIGLFSLCSNAQKVYDPCQKMDTTQIKQMAIGKYFRRFIGDDVQIISYIWLWIKIKFKYALSII